MYECKLNRFFAKTAKQIFIIILLFLLVGTKVQEMSPPDENANYMNTLSIARSLGMSYMEEKLFEKALQHYMKSTSSSKKNKNKEESETICYLTGSAYKSMNNPKKAIEYFEKAVTLNKEDGYSLLQLATLFGAMQQLEKSTEYYEKALQSSKKQDDLLLMGAIHIYYGTSQLFMNDLLNCEKNYFNALNIFRKINEYEWITGNLFLFAKLEQVKGNEAQAKEYMMEALQTAIEQNIQPMVKIGQMIIAELAMAQQRGNAPVPYKEDTKIIEDAIAAEATLRVAAEIAAKYETAKKELILEQLQNIIQKQNTQRWFFVSGIAVCVLILILLWIMLRLRNRRNHALTEKTELLAEMNATKDKFFSIISHDLKNPAVAQCDAIQILFDKSAQWDADTLHNYCGKLLHSANAQVELLTNLLNWAQLQSGRIVYNPVPCNIVQALHSDIVLFTKIAEDKGVRFQTELPQQLIVTADADMIATVVRNLLANAIKFTASGGTVTLKIERKHEDAKNLTLLHSYGLTVSYVISVCDTSAKNIDEKNRHSNRFANSGASDKTGTGLGLMLCRELLEKHNTTLHIESNEGKGNCAWFEI
jgi:signal transduction histidine kinase